VEGGLIIPMALTNAPLAWMVQADVLRKDDDSGYTGAFTFSATTGCELAPRLSGFIEGVVTLPLEGDAETYLNGGLVFEVTPDWMLDAGVNFGLNDAAEDWRLFTGVSFRF
jgi:Putative MetA-pathway of phenol degradation